MSDNDNKQLGVDSICYIASDKKLQPQVDHLQSLINRLIFLRKHGFCIETIDKRIVQINQSQYKLCYAKIHDSANRKSSYKANPSE